MIKQISMPSAGQTTDTALISKWIVAKGDKVKLGDILLEAETDKAVLPVESFTSGIVIDLLAEEGDTVNAGDVLALIGDEKDFANYLKKDKNISKEAPQISNEEENDDSFIPIIRDKKRVKDTSPAPVTHGSSAAGTAAMPNAKKIAKENNVMLSEIIPSNGEYIKRADVEAHLSARTIQKNEEYEVMPLTKMRSVIGRRMLESVHTIPSFQLTVCVNMTRAIELKEKILKIFNKKISYNDLIAKAVAETAKTYKLINSRYESDEIRLFKHTNIGVAVATDEGLVVPVIKNADELGILEIADVNRLNVESARKGDLKSSDMGCGSITLSNLGMYNVEQFTAIINPPESCILALGCIETRPIWENGQWKPVEMMNITATFDHRIMDGAYGAQLLARLRELIEDPGLMLC